MTFYTNKSSRLIILIVTFILTISLGITSFFVKTNYDMTKYLDPSSNTFQGLEILDDTFGNHATIELMTKGMTIDEMVSLKQAIKGLDDVESVIFIDDYVNLSETPIEFVPEEIKGPFIQSDYMKLQIVFSKDAYDASLDDTLETIEGLTTSYMRGEVLENAHARGVASKQLLVIMAIIVPICIIILILASKSYIEVLLILLTLGVAIILNTGTNVFLSDISFITMTMAMALQLAMSFDYSLFMIHRYHEYRHLGKEKAIKLAWQKSFKSITTSSLTTIFGFMALMFMQYKIGFDMGFVLAKGILFSYLAVILLLPIGLYYADDWIKKTMHRPFLPNMAFIGHFVFKARYLLLVSLVVIAIGGYYFQDQNTYLYQGTQSESGSKLANDQALISDIFGANQPYVILIKGEDVLREVSLVSELLSFEHVTSVQALVTTVDPNIPRDFIPDDIKSNFINNGYTRIILNTTLTKENEAYFELDDMIRKTTSAYFDEAYYIGVIPSTTDIKTSVNHDTILVLSISIGLVFLVILVMFKNLLLPIILVLVIEASIWLNLGIQSLAGTPILYIGYLIIMSIQLGATIDYAVLMSSRYIEERLSKNRKDALIESVKTSTPTIFISALILSAAGLIEFIVSDMAAIQEIGLLLGRGTMIAFLLTILILPTYLFVFDRFIVKKKPSI